MRKPLLAVSSVNDKGNMVVFDGAGSFIVPGRCPQVTAIRKLLKRATPAIPLHRRNGVYMMKAWRKEEAQKGFARLAA